MSKNKLTIGSLFFMLLGCISCNNSTKKEIFVTSDKFSLLWEITGNGAQKPSFLYGTIHMYDTAVFKIPQEVFSAIDTCENFALELDMDKIDPTAMASKMMINNPDSTLDKLLKPETYAELMKVPFLQMMGEQVNNMKPFFLASFIMVENPMTIQSIELDLAKHAKAKSKAISGIETIDEQMEAIDKTSLAEQVKGIEEMAAYCKGENLTLQQGGKKILQKMYEAYKNQDMDAFEKLEKEFKISSSNSTDSVLLGKRNIVMTDRISDIIKSGKTLFVGVGALHLPNHKASRGVVELLKEKGYTLRPILVKL